MKRSIVLLKVGLLASLMAMARGEAREVPVGASRIDITPSFPVRLSGYTAREKESDRSVQKLWAKALAIGSDDDGPALLISVDNLGIPDAMTEEVLARVRKRYPVSREKLAIAASHTHTAPALSGVAPNIFAKDLPPAEKEHIDRYTKELTDALEKVSLEALADRRPGRISFGEGSVDFAVNRRVLKDGKWLNFGEVANGPVDHSLPVIRFDDGKGGLRAVVTVYACHCTTIDPKDNAVCGDWAGYAQEAIEAANPGCIAFTLIGCGADANPKGRTGLAVAERHGKALAVEADRVLKQSLAKVDEPPRGRFLRVNLPFDRVPSREEFEKLTLSKDRGEAYNAKTFLDRMARGETIPDSVDYPIQSWSFGDDLCVVFLAGEVVVDYVLAIKKKYDPKRVVVVAYANDSPCYIASDRILAEGGYEASGSMFYYARPSRLRPGAEGKILSGVEQVIPSAFLKR